MVEVKQDDSNAVFLASMGRSGSTFISNVLNYDGRYRILFEPFRFDMVAEAADFIFPFYLRPDSRNETYTASAGKIISGQVSSEWIDKENVGRQVQGLPLLIKDIRANFFLKWLKNQFPAMKLILLLRHPCAVVSSWLAAGFGDGSRGRQLLLANEAFVQDGDADILAAYSKVTTDFERLLFFWCFSYQVPFRQFAFDELHTVFYEDMLVAPETTVRALFTYLGQVYDEARVMASLSRPSSTTAKSEASFTRGAARVDKWKESCTVRQFEQAYEIMELFGMGELYNKTTSLPNSQVLKELFG